MQTIYPWADPERGRRTSHFIQHKAGYLNVRFWLGRAAAYFAIWSAWRSSCSSVDSVRQDRTADPAPTRRRQP